MSRSHIRPHMVFADESGNIFDHPDLLMMCRRGAEWALPKPSDLIPLPEESEFFLLPNRHAIGLNPDTGNAEEIDEVAVAAFVSPAYTISAHPVYNADEDAPRLPLFAYEAIGFANGRFYVCAKKVDKDERQVFTGIPRSKIIVCANELIQRYKTNRLMQHLMRNCVMKYSCPAARNLALGRFECPLPISHTCNAHCLGCISMQNKNDTGICASPQNRMDFVPNTSEVLEVMFHHLKNETKTPIFSFGQGCEGEPLTQAELILDVITQFRKRGGWGTVNLNSNASNPDAIERLSNAGLTSLRASVNSAREEVYLRYYPPKGYSMEDVKRSIKTASSMGVHTALNLLYFPGITDTEEEMDALCKMVNECDVDMIQLRNLNIDPEWYLSIMDDIEFSMPSGLDTFMSRLKSAKDNLKFGYFNPYLSTDKKMECEQN